jgi:hypothetical protein
MSCNNLISTSCKKPRLGIIIAASSVFAFPIADVCLTPAGRGGDVGQTPVPSLDAQVAESRRGLACLVAGSPFSSSLFAVSFSLAALWFPSLSVSVLVAKNLNNTNKKNRKIMKTAPTKTRKVIKVQANQKSLFNCLLLDPHCAPELCVGRAPQAVGSCLGRGCDSPPWGFAP